MRARIIEHDIVDSVLDMTHGFSRRIHRLVFDDGISITLDRQHGEKPDLYVLKDLDLEDYKVIAEINVPDHLHRVAYQYLGAERDIIDLASKYLKNPPRREPYVDERGITRLIYPDQAKPGWKPAWEEKGV